MNYIIFQSIKTLIKKLIKDTRIEIFQRLIFTRNKLKLNKRLSKLSNNYTVHICKSTSIYREWITYSGDIALSKEIQVQNLNKHINFLRIVFPHGIRSNKELDILITSVNTEGKKQSNDSELSQSICFKPQNIKYLRNLNHIDIKINKKIKEIKIKKQKYPLTIQTIEKIKSNSIKTIYIILDAINYKNFINSEGYKKNLKDEQSYTYKAFAPSTVTGSSLPSLLTLQPVLTHLIGDYNQWFYSSNLEVLPPDLQTITEIIKDQSEYAEAYTSFSKSMPFYNYFRGFNIYNSRCTGNNYSPSALDLLQINFIENIYFNSQLDSSFFFAHDIGAHPPVFPKINLTNKDKDSSNNSYNYSIEIALNKINLLIEQLKATKQYDNTNIIITSDHTESSPSFSKNKYHLFPSRIEVPIHIKPAKNCNSNKLNNLFKSKDFIPSSYLLSKLFSIIYDININHPTYIFNNICWLSSVYQYPKRNFIYTLGFDQKNEVFITVVMKADILKSKNNNLFIKELKIYLLKNKELTNVYDDSEKNRIKESFSSYVESCRRSQHIPVKQGDQIFL